MELIIYFLLSKYVQNIVEPNLFSDKYIEKVFDAIFESISNEIN